MSAYYNENDPKAAAWLRELIKAGLIADGEVDERSIEDVQPSDLAGFARCHFFAGIGGWSYALRLAGWPDDRAVWTGSCPCQPWSATGQGAGADDPRDLWPAWFDLIRQCSPDVVFGEQVASKAGLGWFDRVALNMEGEDYAVGALDLCAASIGAFHNRPRLWFVAAHARSYGWQGFPFGPCPGDQAVEFARREARRASPASWLSWEVEPCICRAVDALPSRVGRLRGYGNAIVPELGAEVIGAYMELLESSQSVDAVGQPPNDVRTSTRDTSPLSSSPHEGER